MTPGAKVLITSLGLRTRVVACECALCISGARVAVAEYPGLRYPAVFPGMSDRPSHFAARVVVPDDRRDVETRAEQLALGSEP